jgi:hypothetical protein
MDADRDGFVTGEEMDAAAEAMHSDARMASADKVAVVDTDKDGRIASAEHATSARTMFATMDTDADGILTAAEVQAGHDRMIGGEGSP